MRIRSAGRARWRQVPAGMPDQTADHVAARRRLEARLLTLFTAWGYDEVATPTLEYLDTLLHGAGPGVADRLLKLVDSGGEILTLRPEMTVPLARFAATRLLPAGRRPLRLAYVATVFRGQERGSGRLREFTQAGVELIGEGDLASDAEVIALAAEALRVAEVPGASISVGHAGFLRGLLASLPDPIAEATRDLLYRRAFAELNRLVPQGASLEALRRLPTLRGPDALDRAQPLAATDESRAALEALRVVLDRVAVHRPAVRVDLDLGLIRDFDYYSGVVFEAHGPAPGLPLLGGGRYDDLLARFGQPAPATGFAIGLERVLEVTSARPGTRGVVMVVYRGDAYGAAVAAAARLRDAGVPAIVSPTPGAGGHLGVVTVEPDGLRIELGGRQTTVTLDRLVATVQAAWAP
ncbi:MAG: ATP phosphoribosyltransferase regulatory subunit [Armatimonadota bacterium]|nr:ATP phosphoribosyltransferase regulatory subunit [Armatimonadota bacterium]